MSIRRFAFAMALVIVGATAFPALAVTPPLPPQPKVRPAGMPADAIRISPCVVGMGEHWANPRNLPLGPIYGVYDNTIVFTEYMIDRKAFAAGTSYRDILAPLPGHAIDHVDIEFVPYGHAGYPIPHYDLHAYYVPHAVHEAYCPNGVGEITKK